ncbi:MAG: orotidine-5'-phosphate decarboxylase [Anaerolineae bacterium]|nr:orotidine-5'-phosphate decarboxylase [Anaerolineae bacterium]
MTMTMIAKYNARVDEINSLLCVGLDADAASLPEVFRQQPHPQFAFNRHIIEQTHDYAAAYKPNLAFYEAAGEAGWQSLRLTLDYLRAHHPHIVIVGDAKRGDIGSTSEAYARSLFDDLGFDAVTLNPYLGRDALEPFLSRADKGCIILCRTSNPGSGEFQTLRVDNQPLWWLVAQRVCQEWNSRDNCLLVMGATYPDEMRQVRALVGEMTLLIPGIGAQGGGIRQTVTAGRNQAGKGMMINAARSILLADQPGAAARELRDTINVYR